MMSCNVSVYFRLTRWRSNRSSRSYPSDPARLARLAKLDWFMTVFDASIQYAGLTAVFGPSAMGGPGCRRGCSAPNCRSNVAMSRMTDRRLKAQSGDDRIQRAVCAVGAWHRELEVNHEASMWFEFEICLNKNSSGAVGHASDAHAHDSATDPVEWCSYSSGRRMQRMQRMQRDPMDVAGRRRRRLPRLGLVGGPALGQLAGRDGGAAESQAGHGHRAASDCPRGTSPARAGAPSARPGRGRVGLGTVVRHRPDPNRPGDARHALHTPPGGAARVHAGRASQRQQHCRHPGLLQL
mmetsp:Transcript_6698/g.18600  ORF Transcript_6698/g.18600 Transcript_6698/m.18600 type:complete len:295 (-) Transcript_6698:1239-2123(-)